MAHAHRSNVKQWIGIGTLALVGFSGCSTRTQRPVEFGVLTIENVSPDAISVILDFGDRQVTVGRIQPMKQADLRIRPGFIPPSVSRARIIVVPVGEPAAIVSTGSLQPERVQSDWYPRDELIRNGWRYSGSQILSLGPRTR